MAQRDRSSATKYSLGARGREREDALSPVAAPSIASTPRRGAVSSTPRSRSLLPARRPSRRQTSKKYLGGGGGDTFNAKPVGTGPVQFVSWTKDDKVVLEANPSYWGGKIEVDRVIIRSIPETAPRIAALLKGEVDVITQLPPDQGDRVTANAATRVSGALYAGLYVLAVNSKVPPLDNPLVKQAMSLAIDREAIVKELWKSRGIVPNGPIAKGDNHYDASLPPLAYNPKEARERLKKFL